MSPPAPNVPRAGERGGDTGAPPDPAASLGTRWSTGGARPPLPPPKRTQPHIEVTPGTIAMEGGTPNVPPHFLSVPPSPGGGGRPPSLCQAPQGMGGHQPHCPPPGMGGTAWHPSVGSPPCPPTPPPHPRARGFRLPWAGGDTRGSPPSSVNTRPPQITAFLWGWDTPPTPHPNPRRPPAGPGGGPALSARGEGGGIPFNFHLYLAPPRPRVSDSNWMWGQLGASAG